MDSGYFHLNLKHGHRGTGVIGMEVKFHLDLIDHCHVISQYNNLVRAFYFSVVFISPIIKVVGRLVRTICYRAFKTFFSGATRHRRYFRHSSRPKSYVLFFPENCLGRLWGALGNSSADVTCYRQPRTDRANRRIRADRWVWPEYMNDKPFYARKTKIPRGDRDAYSVV